MSVSVAPTTDIATCLALRRVVFIEEQSVPEVEEVDGLDGEALHILAVADGRAVGVCPHFAQGKHCQDRARVRVARHARRWPWGANHCGLFGRCKNAAGRAKGLFRLTNPRNRVL